MIILSRHTYPSAKNDMHGFLYDFFFFFKFGWAVLKGLCLFQHGFLLFTIAKWNQVV